MVSSSVEEMVRYCTVGKKFSDHFNDFDTFCVNLTLTLLFHAAHASCIFKGKIWLTGGKTAAYVTWDLLTSYKVGDVWSSSGGGELLVVC